MLEVLIHEAEQFRVVAAFWVSVHGPVLVGARSPPPARVSARKHFGSGGWVFVVVVVAGCVRQ